MNKERIDKYLSELSVTEMVNFIKTTSQSLSGLRKRLDNALKKEMETTAYCSRAKRTTLYANSYKLSKQYSDTEELLKYIVSKL
jgi:hypothetical protein